VDHSKILDYGQTGHFEQFCNFKWLGKRQVEREQENKPRVPVLASQIVNWCQERCDDYIMNFTIFGAVFYSSCSYNSVITRELLFSFKSKKCLQT